MLDRGEAKAAICRDQFGAAGGGIHQPRVGLAAARRDQRAARDDIAEDAPLLLLVAEIGDDARRVGLDLQELPGRCIARRDRLQDRVVRHVALAAPHPVPAQRFGHGQGEESLVAQAREVLRREGRRIVVLRGRAARTPPRAPSPVRSTAGLPAIPRSPPMPPLPYAIVHMTNDLSPRAHHSPAPRAVKTRSQARPVMLCCAPY